MADLTPIVSCLDGRPRSFQGGQAGLVIWRCWDQQPRAGCNRAGPFWSLCRRSSRSPGNWPSLRLYLEAPLWSLSCCTLPGCRPGHPPAAGWSLSCSSLYLLVLKIYYLPKLHFAAQEVSFCYRGNRMTHDGSGATGTLAWDRFNATPH